MFSDEIKQQGMFSNLQLYLFTGISTSTMIDGYSLLMKAACPFNGAALGFQAKNTSAHSIVES